MADTGNIRIIINAGKFILRHLPFHKKLTALTFHHYMHKGSFKNLVFVGGDYLDLIVLLYFQKKRNGFYVDIGANEGISGSNTYILEQSGWHGVCVEPQPAIFKQLQKNRTCEVYNAAVSNTVKEAVDFTLIPKSNMRSGISETHAEQEKEWIKQARAKTKTIQVKTITFNEIMSNHSDISHIDFLSIDTEGHEMTILKSIDFEKYRFGLIAIENNEPETILEDYMETKGYKLFLKLNRADEALGDFLFIPQSTNTQRIRRI